jgi:molybdopterin adenylyltransferase
MSHLEHRATAPSGVGCIVVTVSDTRTEATDSAGRAIADLLAAGGHLVVARHLVRDEPAEVRAVVEAALARDDARAIITTGGTGISSRDRTYEALASLLERRLDGFGELFRVLSYEQVGSAAMLSRAMAGVARGKLIACLPGSEAAVRLAMERLLVPELGHIVRELSR